MLRQIFILMGLCCLVSLLGCSGTGISGVATEKVLLGVDFDKDRPLRYRFVSKRDIDIHWDKSDPSPKSHKKSTESVEMIVSYTPLEVDPYGITTIKAYCESVKAYKSGASKKDAVEFLEGKSFTITVGPNGKIHDASDLRALVRQAGEQAFRKNQRIKDPDLIEDFIATQWFLWDSISSIEEPAEGVTVGQQWESKLIVPNSMVIRLARDVVYQLVEVRDTPSGRLAVIKSTYTEADSAPKDWPLPWSGSFQLSGQFGFFRSIFGGLSVVELTGQGEETFNIDRGLSQSYQQRYTMRLKPNSVPLAGTDPLITIEQHLSMQLLEE